MINKPTYEELEQKIQNLEKEAAERKNVEEALRESEERYREVFNKTSEGILVAEVKSKQFRFANPAICQMLGYSEDELIGMKVRDIHTEESLDLVLSEFEAHARGDRVWVLNIPCRRRDGKIIYVDINTAKASIQGVEYNIDLFTDITERKQAEEDLEQIFAMSLDMICIADINTATFIKVNPAFTEILGHSEEALLEKPFLDFVHPDDIDVTRTIIEQELQSGVKVINFENRYLCKDGSYRWLSWVSHPNMEKGVTFAVARDITEWKQNEEMLKKGKELLNATGRMAKVGGWELDIDTLEVTWTEETHRIHEVPLDYKPLLQEAIIFFHPEERGRLERAVQRALDYGESYDMELRFITAKGNHLWTRTKCEPEIVNGKTVKLKGTFQDITELKQAEDKIRKSEEKYRKLYEDAAIGIFHSTFEGRFLDVNPSLARMLGYETPQDVVDSIYNIAEQIYVEPQVRDEVIAQLLAKGETIKVENIYRRKDGSEWNAYLQLQYVIDSNRQPICLEGFVEDITERKRAEEKQKKLEAQLSNAMEMAHLGHWEYNVENDLFAFNDQFYKIFRTTAEQVGGYYMSSAEYAQRFVHPDDRDMVGEEISKCIETSDPNFNRQLEHRVLYADGKVGYISVRYFIVKDEQGNTVKTHGVNQDITDRKRAEDLLRESEARYRTVLNTINEGVILQAASGEILTWNKGAENIFGISAENAIGQTSEGKDWPTIHENGSKFEGKDHPSMRTLRAGTPFRNEIMGVYQPSGELRWISINTNPLYRADEAKPHAVVISFADITEIKKEKDQSQMYLDATTDGIWTWNFKTNTLFFSPKYYKMLGYWPDAFPADYDHWVNLIHPDDREKALAVAAEYLRTKPDDYENEFRLRTVDGNYRWIRARAKVMERDTKGEAVLMAGNHEDITEHKQAELTLRESEEKFRNFTEQSFVGFYIIQDGLFKYVNPKFAEIFGYTVDECLDDMPFSQLVHPEDRAKVEEQVRKRIDGEIRSVQYTFRGVRKTGQTITVEIYGSSFDFKGRPAAIGTMLDITKEQELENRVLQAQKMESIGTLAGGIAHDFNNILFPMMGFAEMALDDVPEDNPLREKLWEILQGTKRASDLVKQILTFSRQSDRKPKPLKVQLVVKEVLKLIRATIPTTIEIKQDISNDCGLVMADATQIHQVCMNLMTNAYHAMENETGMMEVSLKEVELGSGERGAGSRERGFHVQGHKIDKSKIELPSGTYVCLTVSDTGTGVEPHVLNKIFDPYFTTKEDGKGTGLGLAVVHGIVKSYGGDIKVYSEPGKGTAFHVYLPVIKSRIEPKQTDYDVPVLKGTERILLVDDEETIARMEKQMMERLGYDVTARVSSTDALEAFRAAPDKFDLVITDMTMPNMTGIQLAQKLLEIRPDIPIIICTGFSTKIDEARAKEYGIRGFVMKPVVQRELAKKIREVLDGAESVAQV